MEEEKVAPGIVSGFKTAELAEAAKAAYLRGPVARVKDGCSLCGKPDCWYARHPLCEILDVLTRLGMLGNEPVWREEWRLRAADAPAADQVSSALPSEEAAALGCRDSAVQRSGAVPGDTPVVHSTLLEMIGLAATGRCMACGWILQRAEERGVGSCRCEQGNCSFRPGDYTPEYPRWWQRTQILTLARKYLKGELGKDAAAEAGR